MLDKFFLALFTRDWVKGKQFLSRCRYIKIGNWVFIVSFQLYLWSDFCNVLISNWGIIVNFICLGLVIHGLPDLRDFIEFSLLASGSWGLDFISFWGYFLFNALSNLIYCLYLASLKGFLDGSCKFSCFDCLAIFLVFVCFYCFLLRLLLLFYSAVICEVFW
jgi:hypothetical protein